MPNPRLYFFAQGLADADGDLKRLVGGKGASLAAMTRARLNVPPGFTISTECCEHFYKNHGAWPDGLRDDVHAAMKRLESISGRSFGAGDDPLLVAVRSGAAQSMPGMMDTVLNVGLHPECIRAFARRTSNPRGAWDAYYHFLIMYLKTVAGIDEASIDACMRLFLEEAGESIEDEFNASELEALCGRLEQLHQAKLGRPFPHDPWEQLTEAITAVFRSWNNDRAVAYRKHHGVEGLLGTAVNVQIMCPSEVSGVLFTANPVNPALDEIIIEASYGLGEAIVLGRVTPDRFVVGKRDLAIKERNISKKDKVVASLGQEGQGVRDAASLSDSQVMDLARLGLRVEEYFKHPCDIEWGISSGDIYLLQARAIKIVEPEALARDNATLASDSGSNAQETERVRQEEIAVLRARAEPGGTVWSRFNLYEILPRPTPLTWAIVKRFMSGKGGFGQMYRDLGFDPDPALDDDGVFDLICGRPYCNLSREPRMQYRSLPFEHKFSALKANPAKAMYPQATLNPARAGWKFWLTIPFTFFKLWRSSARLRRISQTFAADFETRIAPDFLKEVDAAANDDLAKLSNQQLLDRLHHWIQRTLYDFARDSLKPTALAAIAMGNLERVLAQRYQPPGSPAPPEGQPTGAQGAQAALRELVMHVKAAPDADLAAAVAALQQGRMTRDEFLRGFGHRGPQEMELSQPRWRETPAALPVSDASQKRSAPPAETANPWDQIAADAKLAPHERAALEAEGHILHTYLRLREAGKHYLLRGYALVRDCLVEIGRRTKLGDDIFFLLPDELPRAFEADEAIRKDLANRIDERRRRRDIALSLSVPQVLFSDDLEAIGRAVEADASRVFQGVPLSAGVAEAPALVLLDAAGAHAPATPYILVCPSTDPAWVPLFIHAKGLVMETGGVLSHGAIVAREFGLPAVAGIADVHRRLRTGQRLRLDGATGKLTLLDEFGDFPA